jgi:hypothetical protein
LLAGLPSEELERRLAGARLIRLTLGGGGGGPDAAFTPEAHLVALDPDGRPLRHPCTPGWRTPATYGAEPAPGSTHTPHRI